MSKWNLVENKFPEDDKYVTAYIENTENSLYNELKICSYIDGNWYCKGGINSQEIVVKWVEIPQ